jgi:hypothetical protein
MSQGGLSENLDPGIGRARIEGRRCRSGKKDPGKAEDLTVGEILNSPNVEGILQVLGVSLGYSLNYGR